ncbi:TPA: hypothetical protein LR281_004607 [Escherichia coli]|jgi:hypothetical protein|nr:MULTISPECIES: hypothetical protein [Enterobacteriaceae]EKV3692682.1 hypothetical protein [Enterobacter hormaechei]EKV4586509.1 hypothetical protein [Enterobacter hormaechei]MBF1938060.1 hypothetical protein [Enterobacter hormaechei]MBF9209954.1 hypothetical protein [Enterobacter hormaechei]MBY7162009.1 hypothetical protein [Enterobacter hormaechei]
MSNDRQDYAIQEADARERRQFRYCRWCLKWGGWFMLALYLLWRYVIRC